MKQYKKSLIMAIGLALGSYAHSAYAGDVQSADSLLGTTGSAVRADDVPAGDAGRYYMPGAALGQDAMPSDTFSKQIKIDANAKAYANMSCGSVKFGANIKQMGQDMLARVQEIPGQVISGVQGMVGSLPNYILAKVSPTLYELSQKGLDDYMSFFNIKMKSCGDIENDLRNHPDKNPYGSVMQIAIGDTWKYNVGAYNEGNSSFSDLSKNTETKAAEDGVTLADGKSYGGKDQDPIDFIKSIASAGENILTGRSGDKSSWGSSIDTSSSENQNNPIVAEFGSDPNGVYDFISRIYGSKTLKLYQDGKVTSADGATASTPGQGYEKEYASYRDELFPSIRDRVQKKMSRADFEKKTGIIKPPAEWDDIRMLPTYQQQVQIEELTKKYAIDKLKRRLILAKQVLKTGMYSPDIQGNATVLVAKEEYKEIYYRIIDDLAEIQNRMYQ